MEIFKDHDDIGELYCGLCGSKIGNLGCNGCGSSDTYYAFTSSQKRLMDALLGSGWSDSKSPLWSQAFSVAKLLWLLVASGTLKERDFPSDAGGVNRILVALKTSGTVYSSKVQEYIDKCGKNFEVFGSFVRSTASATAGSIAQQPERNTEPSYNSALDRALDKLRRIQKPEVSNPTEELFRRTGWHEPAASNYNNTQGQNSGGGENNPPQNPRGSMASNDEIKAALDFFKKAENMAARGDFAGAVEVGEEVLKTLAGTPYEGMYSKIVEKWKAQNTIEKEIEEHATSWFGMSGEDIDKEIRSRLDDLGKDIKDPKVAAARTALRKKLIEAQRRAESTKGRGNFTIEDDITKIVDEANKLADSALDPKSLNPSKLERGIARLESALALAKEHGLTKRVREIEPLIARYRAKYQQVLQLVRISEKGRASPWADEKFEVLKDDVEVQRDDFDALAAKIDIWRSRPGDKNAESALRSWMVKLQGKYHDEYSKDALSKAENLLSSGSSHPDFEKNAKAALTHATAASEYAKNFAELIGGYGGPKGTHESKAKQVRDKYRGRITGYRHWGEGGNKWFDAAEWVGFSRDPIETIGNLAATVLTVYLVTWKIVGPVLDMFSFYIPFLNSVLKYPILLIAIIIFHPFIKAILHPIKMDLGRIAKDPYWYEHGEEKEKEEKKVKREEEEEKEIEEERGDETSKKHRYPHETQGDGLAEAHP